MRVVFLLGGSALFGGVKVVLQMARALRRLGVDAGVVSPDPPPAWFEGASAFCRQVDAFEPQAIGPCDFAIGTIWFTVPPATRVPGAIAVHLCQCYEPLFDGIRDQWDEIEAIYRLPTVKLAISPHLVDLVATRTGQTVHYVPQAFESDRFVPPAHDRPEDGRLRVLVSGPWEVPIKGLDWGLPALRPLAEEGWLDLVRLSLETRPEELAVWPQAERHLHVPPDAVPPIVQSVDVYLSFCSEVEGFGLPALEAMSCGRAAVLTDVGAVRALDPDARASLRVPFGDGEALRAAVRMLRDDVGLRRQLGREGRRIAERFTEERTALALAGIFESALTAARSAKRP